MNHIELNPKPSRLLLGLCITLHLLVFFAISLSNTALLFKALFGCYVLISGFYTCYFVVLQHSPRAIIKCIYQDAEWILYDRSNRADTAILLGDSLITSFLIMLNFRLKRNNRRTPFIVFKDALPQETFRQLRVLLRLKKK